VRGCRPPTQHCCLRSRLSCCCCCMLAVARRCVLHVLEHRVESLCVCTSTSALPDPPVSLRLSRKRVKCILMPRSSSPMNSLHTHGTCDHTHNRQQHHTHHSAQHTRQPGKHSSSELQLHCSMHAHWPATAGSRLSPPRCMLLLLLLPVCRLLLPVCRACCCCTCVDS
jgi:hypothetical protein